MANANRVKDRSRLRLPPRILLPVKARTGRVTHWLVQGEYQTLCLLGNDMRNWIVLEAQILADCESCIKNMRITERNQKHPERQQYRTRNLK